MDVIALVLSGLALVVSIVATVLSNRRAHEAIEEARSAKTQALWPDAIEAVHRVIVDPTTEPLTDRLQTLRVSEIAPDRGSGGVVGVRRLVGG